MVLYLEVNKSHFHCLQWSLGCGWKWDKGGKEGMGWHCLPTDVGSGNWEGSLQCQGASAADLAVLGLLLENQAQEKPLI